MKHSLLTAICCLLFLITGCSASRTALEHRTLQTETKLSKTIFLDPVPDRDKTIFIAIKNTSDQTLFIEDKVKQAIAAKGYRIIPDPNKAHYRLQANTLQIGKTDQATLAKAQLSPYGSQIASTLGTIATVAQFSQTSSDLYTAGLLGAGASFVADSLVKDVMYVMITDVQISEKKTSANGRWKQHQARIISNADQVNLKFADARQALENGLVKSLAGLF